MSIVLMTAASSGATTRMSTNIPVEVAVTQAPTTSPTGIPFPLPPLPRLDNHLLVTPPDIIEEKTTEAAPTEQHKMPPRTHPPILSGLRRPRLVVPSASIGTFRDRVVRAVQDVMGTPYRYGAESPNDGFDCSGLTMWAYGRVGISLPRRADDQMRAMKRVIVPTAGDLVFFLDSGGYAYHAGVYVSPGQMIAAPKTGDHVRVERIWTDSVTYRAAV